jgi:hypothetical protein
MPSDIDKQEMGATNEVRHKIGEGNCRVSTQKDLSFLFRLFLPHIVPKLDLLKQQFVAFESMEIDIFG